MSVRMIRQVKGYLLLALALAIVPSVRATTLVSGNQGCNGIACTETDTGGGSSAIAVSASITFTVLDSTHLEVLIQNTTPDPFLDAQNISAASFQIFSNGTAVTQATSSAIEVCNSATVAVGTCNTALTINNGTAASQLSTSNLNPTASANGNVYWYSTSVNALGCTGSSNCWGNAVVSGGTGTTPNIGTNAFILSSQDFTSSGNNVSGICGGMVTSCGGLTPTTTYCSTSNIGSANGSYGANKNMGGTYCFPSIIGQPVNGSGYVLNSTSTCQGDAVTNVAGVYTTSGDCNSTDGLASCIAAKGGNKGACNDPQQTAQSLYESAAFVLTLSTTANLSYGKAYVAFGPDGPDEDDWINLSTPEPSTFVLMGAGLALLGFRKYRASRK